MNESSTEDDLEYWRAVGELYGRVKANLGKGSLHLIDGSTQRFPGVYFRWQFVREGKDLYVNYAVAREVLEYCVSVEVIAMEVTERLRKAEATASG